ncbi:hypothetical protein GQR58_021055 [Nymphon striatum]|nr:hypothetical protein GQR58_021055 [Nymphon striatum]
MMNNLSPPPIFLSGPTDIPTLPWSKWFRLFDTYIIAVGADSFSDARRKALLLHCLGQGGQDVFANLTVVSTDGEKNIKSVYDVAVLTLMSHFAKRSNVVAERHKFRMRVQQVDERVDAFVNSLQELALRCEFACPDCNSPSIKNVMVRDQVVEGVSDKKIQERLIIEGDLPLDKCLQLARQIEDAKRDALKLRNSGSGASDYYDGSVNAVKFRQSLRPRQQKSIEGKPLCFRCGSTDHLASSERCPAFGKRCNACQRMNHFSRCCRTRGQTSRAVNQVEYAEGDNSLDMEVLAISGITHKKGQNKYKMNADGRRYTTAKEFKIGDLVKIKQIGKSGKGPKYSDPIKILKTVGPGTYLTEDMKVWNTSKLVKVHSPDTYDMSELFDYNSNLVKPSHNDGNTNANNDVVGNANDNMSNDSRGSGRYNLRTKLSKPRYLDDYE